MKTAAGQVEEAGQPRQELSQVAEARHRRDKGAAAAAGALGLVGDVQWYSEIPQGLRYARGAAILVAPSSRHWGYG